MGRVLVPELVRIGSHHVFMEHVFKMFPHLETIAFILAARNRVF